MITDLELSFKLGRLAQQLGTYLERPQSPLPKRKQDLMNQVNMLARFYFKDPDDVQLLQKLIQDENDMILAVFDVYESDNNHENLIDSLQRILEKSKAMGIHIQSITASSFYNNDHQQHSAWQRGAPAYAHHQQPQPPQPNAYNMNRPPHVLAQMVNQMRATTPTAQFRNRSHHARPDESQMAANNRLNSERPPTMAGM